MPMLLLAAALMASTALGSGQPSGVAADRARSIDQDPPKQEEQHEPTPKMGFSRKADKTYRECVDFFWHDVTYAVYTGDHLPNSPPVNIKIGDKNTGKPCRAPAPEHLPGLGTELADSPERGLKRREDVVVSVCINDTWHDITYALFERWDEKDEPDLTTPPIRVQIKDEEGLPCKPITTPKPQPPGTAPPNEGKARLGSAHARSECGDDGWWHVISDEDWIRPDGTHFKKRHDEKTAHRCQPGDAIPADLPGGVQPPEQGARIEDKEIRECINGFYWYRKYAQYKRADGSTWVDNGPGKWLSEMTKNEPCSEKTIGMRSPTWILQGGATLASLSASDEEFQAYSRWGLAGGVAMVKPLGDRSAFMLDLLFATKGAKFNLGATDEVLGLKYLDVLPSYRYEVFHNDKVSFHVGVGPSLGLKMGEHITIGGETQTETTDFAKGWDMGVSVMAGFELTPRVSTCIRYTQGLTNILNTSSASGVSVHNHVLQFTVGYAIK